MLKPLLKFSFLFAFVSLVVLSSCNKESTDSLNLTDVTEEDLADPQIFTALALFELQENTSVGPYGCFELVFPITLVFPDATTSELNDYDELKATVLAWKEANPDATERPTFEFPVEVLSADGELISVADRAELRELKKACGGNFPGKGNKGHGKCSDPCFDIVYPLTLAFPDATTAEANDRTELKSLIRAWKDANPDATERPEVVFPIEVEMEADGSVVSVADKDALKALKESCQD